MQNTSFTFCSRKRKIHQHHKLESKLLDPRAGVEAFFLELFVTENREKTKLI